MTRSSVSTGQFVEVRVKVGTHEPKLLLKIPIEDYIDLKLALQERGEWEKLAYAYELKSGTVGLGELITSFTDFEIPLPSVGVLSIFGEPKIRLKIGGSVQIHGAWRSETTEGVTANRLGNTRNEPDFKQQVQINVSGTIGDKLNINADWNTERTFEYENQLKIKYAGYDDEIIQSIEAGNVSMQTPSLIETPTTDLIRRLGGAGAPAPDVVDHGGRIPGKPGTGQEHSGASSSWLVQEKL